MNGAPMLLDDQLRPVAILDRALRLSWELKHNDLHTAEISLARENPRNEQCVALAWVHLWDGARDLGLYRITGIPDGDELPGGAMTYSLEHLLALLLDDVIFGELSLEDVPFGDAIRQVMARQTAPRWVLGDCDFDLQVTDTLGNETILSAIRRLCGKLTEDYTWDYDTGALPFVLHIRRADQDNGCGIHFGRNMVGVNRQMDATKVVTRLYLLGGADGKAKQAAETPSGGGADDQAKQVTVESLTAGGVPYIDADTIGTYGIRTAIYQNGDLATPEALMARGQEVLEALKNPHYAYQVSALDLYRLTGYAWDLFAPGKKVLVMDDRRGVRFSARIVSVAKQDAGADPGSVTLTIANQPRDELDTVAAITQKLQSVETNGIRTAAQLQLRATLKQFDALTGRITQAESAIEVQAEGITAVSGRVTTLEGDMTETKAQIKVNNDSIGALVTKTETLDGRLTTEEAAVEILSNNMSLYVKKGEEISSSIELSGDGVTISGGVITLTGYAKAEDLEAKYVTTDELGAKIADLSDVSVTNLSVSGTAHATDLQIWGQASIGGSSCAPHTLTIGEQTCTFFAPADATFDWSDIQEVQDALDAARMEGASSVYVKALEVYDESYHSSTKTISASLDVELAVNGTSSHLISVNATKAFDEGSKSVTLTPGEWSGNTCTISASNGQTVTVTKHWSSHNVVSSGDTVFVRYNGAMVNATYMSGGSKVSYISSVSVE